MIQAKKYTTDWNKSICWSKRERNSSKNKKHQPCQI